MYGDVGVTKKEQIYLPAMTAYYAFILGLEQIDDFAWCSMYKN